MLNFSPIKEDTVRNSDGKTVRKYSIELPAIEAEITPGRALENGETRKLLKVKKPLSFKQVLEKTRKQNRAAMKKLVLVTSVSLLFIVAEIYGGYKSGSIAIFTDAAHLSADIFGFGFSIIALKISQKSSNESLSYGWHRSEIIGTMFSIATMWIMTLWLLVEATNRFFEPPKVHGWIMLMVACIGLVFNLIQIKILHTGDGHYHLGGDNHGHDHHCHGHGEGHGHNHGEHVQ